MQQENAVIDKEHIAESTQNAGTGFNGVIK